MNKIPVMYLCVHKRLKDKFSFETFPLKEVLWILGKIYHIKKKYHYPILKELEDFKLLNKINQNEVVLLKCNINLEDTSKIYRKVGLY